MQNAGNCLEISFKILDIVIVLLFRSNLKFKLDSNLISYLFILALILN